MRRIKQNKRGKLLENIWLILSAGVLIFAIWATFFRKAEGQFVAGFRPFIVATGSMRPKHEISSLVVIKKVDFSEVQVNDAIAYKSEAMSGNIVFHRAIKKTDDGFIMKGDANDKFDREKVTAENFIGKEVWHTNAVVPYINKLRTENGILKFALLPLLSIMATIFVLPNT